MKSHHLMGLAFQCCKCKTVDMDDGDGCTTMQIYLMPLNHALKKDWGLPEGRVVGGLGERRAGTEKYKLGVTG